MGRTLYKWRIGPGPNYTYAWDFEAPANAEAIVESVTEEAVSIKQERKTPGHYVAKPIVISDIPAGQARYKDLVIPDYTNGMDILSAHIDTSQFTTGDEMVCGKVVIGQIGQLAANASQNDTVITIATNVQGLLKSTILGGALDEGFSLSIGTDSATDTSINAGPPSGNLLNPDQEVKEYEIKRIGAEQNAGGGTYTCQVTLFTGLAANQSAGAAVNLVCPFFKEIVQVTQNGSLNLGGETFTAGNIPAGKRIRFGYKNNAGSAKTVRVIFGMLY